MAMRRVAVRTASCPHKHCCGRMAFGVDTSPSDIDERVNDQHVRVYPIQLYRERLPPGLM